MTQIKKICIALILYCFILPAQAQQSLEPVEDAASAISAILGGNKGITEVRLITDTEQSVTVDVDYKGFVGKYQVKGFILDQLKKPVEEIVCETEALPKADGTIDLKLEFKAGSRSYTSSTLESHFLSLVFSKSDGLLSGIELGGQYVLGETYLYKLKKTWRVGGSESMVITVKLTPYKSAASIQP